MATFGVVGLLTVFDLARQVLFRVAPVVALMVAVGPMSASLSASYMTDVPTSTLAMICSRWVLGLFDPMTWMSAVSAAFLFVSRGSRSAGPRSSPARGVSHRTLGGWSLVRPRLTAAIATLLSVVGCRRSSSLASRASRLHEPTPQRRADRPRSRRRTKASNRQRWSVYCVARRLARRAGAPRGSSSARAPRTSVAVGLVTVSRSAVKLHGTGVRHFSRARQLRLPERDSRCGILSGTRPDLYEGDLRPVGVGRRPVRTALRPCCGAADARRVGPIRQKHLGTPASPPLAIVTLAALGYGLACALPALFRLASFDRYLLPLIALVGILALQTGEPAPSAQRGVRIIGAGALLGLALFGLIYAANSASFDGTKWRVAEQASKSAGSPKLVEGGFEWTNYHAGKQIFFANRDHPAARSASRFEQSPIPLGRKVSCQPPRFGVRQAPRRGSSRGNDTPAEQRESSAAVPPPVTRRRSVSSPSVLRLSGLTDPESRSRTGARSRPYHLRHSSNATRRSLPFVEIRSGPRSALRAQTERPRASSPIVGVDSQPSCSMFIEGIQYYADGVARATQHVHMTAEKNLAERSPTPSARSRSRIRST